MHTQTTPGIDPVTCFALTDSDRQHVLTAAARIATDPDDDTLLAHARELAAAPLQLWADLCSEVRAGMPCGGVLVTGLPVDPTTSDAKVGHATELVLLAAGSCLGTPIGYAAQRGGRLVHELRPVREHAAEQLGTGSVTLVWHTEEAHTDLSPRFVVLLCVRGDAEAATLISRVRPEVLPDTVRARLERDDSVVTSDASYDGANTERRCAVLAPGRFTFDPLFTQCADDEAQAALGALARHVDREAGSVVLRPGDLLVIDNFAAAHARSAYTPRYDGTDRWLQRTVVLQAPPPPSAIAPGRPNVVTL